MTTTQMDVAGVRSLVATARTALVGHVYALDHVDWSTNPPTAHLRNPWGFDNVTMPLDDLRAHTTYLTVGK